MKKYLSNYWKAFLTVLFGVAVFLFWRYAYPFALSYQEQFLLSGVWFNHSGCAVCPDSAADLAVDEKTDARDER